MAIHKDDHKEVLIMGKGVGFGRKVAERIEVRPEDRLYSFQKYKERGGAKEIVKSIAPEFLEVTNAKLLSKKRADTFCRFEFHVK